MQDFKYPFSISAAEAVQHGFPPVDIKCELAGSGLMPFKFPEENKLVFMGGPPGGPSHLSIEWLHGIKGEALPSPGALARRQDVQGNAFRFGGTGQFVISGKKYDAVSWSIKPTPWLDSSIGVLIPIDGAHDALWITFSGWYDDKEGFVAGPNQQIPVQTLTIKIAP